MTRARSSFPVPLSPRIRTVDELRDTFLTCDNTFNKALAQLLSATAAGADLKTLEGSPDATSAQGYYLKAIIAARQDNVADVVSNLKNAFSADSAWKNKALKDKEFLKYIENPEFSAVIK